VPRFVLFKCAAFRGLAQLLREPILYSEGGCVVSCTKDVVLRGLYYAYFQNVICTRLDVHSSVYANCGVQELRLSRRCEFK
jgi:hypothetical protein